MQMNKTDLIKMVAEKANKPTKEVAEIMAQLQISVAYFCSIGLYFLV